MKALSYFSKALTAVSAAATALFFFFEFFAIKGFYSLTGFQMIFGSTQTVNGSSVVTYKSMWYLTAFFLALFTAGFVIMTFFKFKGMKFAAVGSSALLAINMLVIYCTSVLSYFDVRTSPTTKIAANLITRQPAATLAFAFALAAFALAFVNMFVSDYAEVLESNGAKLTIPKRVKNFFKDYKSEITKIVWPSRNTVFKNVVIVLIMCLVIGAFIWLLDWGLAELLKLILGI